MNQYHYVAKADNGKIQRGQITCESPADARQQLAQRGRRLVSIQELTKKTGSFKQLLSDFFRRNVRPISTPDMVLMLEQLSVMISSGLELTASLRELSRYSPKRRVRRLCDELASEVEHGKSLAKAIDGMKVFPPVVSKLAHVGESTGDLSITLERAAQFIDKRRQTRGSLLAALAYPTLVAIAATCVATYLVGWAIPKLAVFLSSMGRKLPAMTQSLLDLSAFVQAYMFYGIVAGISLGIAFLLTYSWEPGRYRIDQCLLRVPIIGRLLKMAETQQLASSLSLMLQSGVLLQDALGTAATLHRNQYLATEVSQSKQKLAAGSDLASSLANPGFSPMFRSMIAIGEQTGDLPRALDHVAKHYAAQLDTKITRLGKWIEPAIIVLAGGAVGYVYVAFFMAMLSAGGNFN